MKYDVFDYASDRLPDVPDTIWFYRDEWENKRAVCESFFKSKEEGNTIKLDARSCTVEEIPSVESDLFLDENHLQGSSHRSRVVFGLRHQGTLVGVVSLGDHHRQSHDKTIVLDRVCFKAGVTVRGGLSRLLSRCIAWSKDNDIDLMLTFSDNRLTDGSVYEKLGFVFDGKIRPDYFYLDSAGRRHSKQSQKKQSVKCPADMTEYQWATKRGLRRFYDLGKRRWVMKINPASLTKKEKQSLICAEQHSQGLFKKNKIRGYMDWHGKPIYFGSSYELRFLFESSADVDIASVRRADYFATADGAVRGRNPDFLVTHLDGSQEIVEIKPSTRIQEAVSQIKDSQDYAREHKLGFRLWTEKDSDLGDERKIILWARRYLASLGQTHFLTEAILSARTRANKHYHAKLKNLKIEVYCEFCCDLHTIREPQYRANLSKNGRYICHAENAVITGKRPKDHLKNPLASEGKKKCSGECGRILELDHFSVSNKITQSRCGKCKECRAREATAKYQMKRKAETREP